MRKTFAGVLYVLNPGDGVDVVTWRDRSRAEHQLTVARKGEFPYARLYSHDRGRWRIYETGAFPSPAWVDTSRGNLPIKVLDAPSLEKTNGC